MDQWMLVGVLPNTRRKGAPSVKVIGPFLTADEAREDCNSMGVGEPVRWSVVPLMSPGKIVR